MFKVTFKCQCIEYRSKYYGHVISPPLAKLRRHSRKLAVGLIECYSRAGDQMPIIR